MYSIYKITETESGKIYIGSTTGLSGRLRSHRCSLGLFYEKQHTVEVLCKTNDKDSAFQLEQYWCEKLKSYLPEIGYNVSIGAKHGESTKIKIGSKALGRTSALKGVKLSEETKKMKAIKRDGKGYLRGKQHPGWMKSPSDEVKSKMSEGQRKRAARGDKPFLGQKHTDKTRQRMSASKKGKAPSAAGWNIKKVRNIDTGDVYNSLREAQMATGAPSEVISLCCKGKRQRSGGYRWEFL